MELLCPETPTPLCPSTPLFAGPSSSVAPTLHTFPWERCSVTRSRWRSNLRLPAPTSQHGHTKQQQIAEPWLPKAEVRSQQADKYIPLHTPPPVPQLPPPRLGWSFLSGIYNLVGFALLWAAALAVGQKHLGTLRGDVSLQSVLLFASVFDQVTEA